MPQCAFDGCDKPAKTKTLCNAHYLQHWRGKELKPLDIRSKTDMTEAERFWHRVDKQPNGCWIWTGNIGPGGYGQTSKGQAHRIAWEMLRGPIPDGLILDHDNPDFGCRNPACVNPDHLEPVTHAVNCQRPRGARSHSSTGIRGVSPHRNRFRARVVLNGKEHSAGVYDTPQEAAAAAESLRRRLFR